MPLRTRCVLTGYPYRRYRNHLLELLISAVGSYARANPWRLKTRNRMYNRYSELSQTLEVEINGSDDYYYGRSLTA